MLFEESNILLASIHQKYIKPIFIMIQTKDLNSKTKTNYTLVKLLLPGRGDVRGLITYDGERTGGGPTLLKSW